MLAKRVYRALKTNDLGKLCNWALNRYEFSRRPLILRSYPTEASIEVTNNCPLQCIHCPRSYRNLHKIDMKLGSLSLDHFLAIIDKLRFVRFLGLHGLGEPLLNADIFRMIEAARKRRFLVSFSTSASYFNKEIEHGLRRAAPDSLTISLDSLEKNRVCPADED
jgi:MoaA/NifB/PqqE/SkfB family radical SAM enzyme